MRRCILLCHAYRGTPLLRQGGIINNEKALRIADQPVRLRQKSAFERSSVPCATRDEMVKLVVARIVGTRRQRLDALAVTRTDETGYVGRTQAPRSVRKVRMPLVL